MSRKTKVIETTGRLSSMKSIRVHENSDESITVNIFEDNSHGDRTFRLDKSDWLAFIDGFS